jgi:hypothetical protein
LHGLIFSRMRRGGKEFILLFWIGAKRFLPDIVLLLQPLGHNA